MTSQGALADFVDIGGRKIDQAEDLKARLPYTKKQVLTSWVHWCFLLTPWYFRAGLPQEKLLQVGSERGNQIFGGIHAHMYTVCFVGQVIQHTLAHPRTPHPAQAAC